MNQPPIPEDRTTHLLVGAAAFLGLFALVILGGILIRGVTGMALLSTVFNLVGGFLVGRKAAQWYYTLPPRQSKKPSWTEDDGW